MAYTCQLLDGSETNFNSASGIFLLSDRWLLAMVIFAVVIFTDKVDGWVSRSKWGRVTRLGTILDPIVDKIIVIVTLIAQVIATMNPIIIIHTIVILIREILVAYYVANARTRGVEIGVTRQGKLKMVAQSVAIILQFILVASTPIPAWLLFAVYAVIIASIILTWTSGLEYLLDYELRES